MALLLLKSTQLCVKQSLQHHNLTNVYTLRCIANASDINSQLKSLLPDENKFKRELSIKKEKLHKKFIDVVAWYEQFTGLDEVRMAQQRVLDAQDSFVRAQDKRRDVQRQLAVLQTRLKDIHNEIQRTARGEERYLDLVTEEHKIIKEERDFSTEFRESEKLEREHFSVLSNSVKSSHERERLQADKTKYWSLIASVVGTIIGIVGTTINNSFRMKEIKQIVKDSSSQAQTLLLAMNGTSNGITDSREVNTEENLMEYLQNIQLNIGQILSVQNDISKHLQMPVTKVDTEIAYEQALWNHSILKRDKIIGAIAVGITACIVVMISSRF